MAAVLACGPGAALSHFSAGHLWGMCGSRGPIEVLRQSGGFHPKGHQGVRLHQTRRLEALPSMSWQEQLPPLDTPLTTIVSGRRALDLSSVDESQQQQQQ